MMGERDPSVLSQGSPLDDSPPPPKVTHHSPIPENPGLVVNNDDQPGSSTPIPDVQERDPIVVSGDVVDQTPGNTDVQDQVAPGLLSQKQVGGGNKDGGGASSGMGRPGSSTGVEKRTCQYVRGGYCTLHGEKGTKKFKPSWVTTQGQDGRTVKTYKRGYHYVCEQGNKKKIQQQLSFVKTTPFCKTTLTEIAAGTPEAKKTVFTTSTEGQRGSISTKAGVDVVNKK